MHNQNQSQTNNKTNVPGCSNPDLPETLTAEAANAMMQVKAMYTKGPWFIDEFSRLSNEIKIWAKGTPIIAKIFLRDVSINEHQANARLIAAAPELLEALQTLVGHVSHYAAMPHAHADAYKNAANAMSVIRKATTEAK